MEQAPSGHPAGRARTVSVPQPGGGVGDGRARCVSGRGERRAAKPGEMVDVGARERGRRPQFVSRGGIKLANALEQCGLRGERQACARRRRLDGRLHRLPAAARRARGDGGGRRLWRARLPAADRPAGGGAGAHERARADPGDAAAGEGGPDTAPDLASIDVSFISLAKVLGAVLGCLVAEYDVLALVKPQFEVGRGAGRQGGRGARRRGPPRGAGRRGRGGARAGRGGARLLLLGPAGAEGQPRDVHVAAPAQPAAAAAPGEPRRSLTTDGAGGGAVREITVFTHRRAADTARRWSCWHGARRRRA